MYADIKKNKIKLVIMTKINMLIQQVKFKVDGQRVKQRLRGVYLLPGWSWIEVTWLAIYT